jgi:hypothetical protein
MRVVLPAMTVKQIVVDDAPTEGDYVDDFSSYRIEIETNEGRWVIEGCHDAGPDVYMPDGKPFISPDEA